MRACTANAVAAALFPSPDKSTSDLCAYSVLSFLAPFYAFIAIK